MPKKQCRFPGYDVKLYAANLQTSVIVHTLVNRSIRTRLGFEIHTNKAFQT